MLDIRKRTIQLGNSQVKKEISQAFKCNTSPTKKGNSFSKIYTGSGFLPAPLG